MVGVFPLIVAFVVVAIEILVAFIDIIVSAIKSKSTGCSPSSKTASGGS